MGAERVKFYQRGSLPSGLARPNRYNSRFCAFTIMEAERLNALSASLADLAGRLDDLRRYL